MVSAPPVVFVEGGNNERSGDLSGDCREAFGALFKKATGKNIKVKACGSRMDAYDACAFALAEGRNALLLVDAEDVVDSNSDVWTHLRKRKGDGWKSLGCDAFLMAVCMETWLVADLDALERHFGGQLKRAKFKKWPKLEAVAKQTIFSSLEAATKECRKGWRRTPYGKSTDSFKVLALIDPAKLRGACPHADTLFQRLARG